MEALTDGGDVGVVVPLVAVPVHQAGLADVGVSEHEHLVRGREVDGHFDGRHSLVVARGGTCGVDATEPAPTPLPSYARPPSTTTAHSLHTLPLLFALFR